MYQHSAPITSKLSKVITMKRKTVFEFIILACFCYVSLLLALAVFQRSVMYFPDRTVPAVPEGVSLVHIDTIDGLRIPAWYKPPATPDAPVIIWFHGNAGNLSYFWPKAAVLTANGAGLLLPEYRGYGGAPGKPTETNLVADGKAALNWAKSQNIKSEQVVLYGLSLGSGIAVQIAASAAKQGEPVARVILEAPYSSTLDVAKWRFPLFPVGLVMQDTYMSTEYIQDIAAPLLIIHGVNDGIIPQRFGRKLYDHAVDPKQFLSVRDRGHNDLYTDPAVILALMAFLENG